MKNKLLILIIAVISFACKRESPCGEPYESKSYNYYLADSNKANFPYTKIDTLVFVNQDWDTALLVNSDGVIHYTERKGVNGDNNPACQKWDYHYYENMYTKFIGKNKNLNRIDVQLFPQEFGSGGDYLLYTINGKMIYRSYAVNFYAQSAHRFPLIYRGKEVFGVSTTNGSDHLFPGNKIITFKGEGLIAYFINDSNIYIKQ
ncbi:MAG: hypothetical protein Q8R57_07440 [Bacteroidota bacterium]|nr:hypothetical protein [Bacteroidota bacterium]